MSSSVSAGRLEEAREALGEELGSVRRDVLALRRDLEVLGQCLVRKGFVDDADLLGCGAEPEGAEDPAPPSCPDVGERQPHPTERPERSTSPEARAPGCRARSTSPKVFRSGSRSTSPGERPDPSERLVVVGGYASRSDVKGQSTAECLSLESDSWEAIPNIPWRRGHHTATVMDNFLYVCGGNFLPVAKSIIRYEPKRRKWRPVGEMREPREEAAAAACGGRLYVCGGYFGNKVWTSVECFRLDDSLGGVAMQSTFEDVPNMSFKRSGFAAVGLGDSVLVCGGMDRCYQMQCQGHPATGSAEVLRAGAASWKVVQRLRTARFRHAMAVLGGKAVASGGQDSVNGLAVATVESYDPLTDRWTHLPPMIRPRFYHTSAVLAGCLYVCGGMHAESEDDPCVTSSDRFDPEVGKWAVMIPMLSRRGGFCSGVLADRGAN